MLQLFRKHVTSIASKVILAILIISFVFFWGIGDMVRGGGRYDVAQVGPRFINRSMFARELQGAIHILEQKSQEKVTPQMIFSLGLVPLVLNEMIQKVLLDLEAEHLGIGAPDQEISSYIQNISMFQDEAGRFSRSKLQQFLTQARLSEKKFIETLAEDMKRQQLLETLFLYPLNQDDVAPKVLEKVMTHYVYDDRHLQVVTLKDEEMGGVGTPTPTLLKEFYDKEGEEFTTPEQRTFSVAWLDPVKKAAHMKISPEKVRNYYEENQALFQTQPTKELAFISCPSREKAEEMASGLKKGRKLETLLGGLKIKKDKVKTYSFSQEKAANEGISELWEKPVGFVSGPVSKEGHWDVLFIRGEKGRKNLSFEEVKEDLHKKLQLEEAQADIAHRIKHLDDDLAAGTSLSELARQYGMEVVRLENFHEESDPAVFSKIPQKLIPEVLKQVSSLGVGEVGPLAQVGGTYVVTHLESIVEKRYPSLEEIKEKVVEGWKKEERKKKSEALAEKMMAEVRTGLSLEKVASKEGKTVHSSVVSGLKSFEPSSFLNKQIMQMKIGEVTSGRIKGGAVVVSVVDIKSHALGEKEKKKIRDSLSQQMARDILEGYVRQLKEKTKVVTYPRVIQSLFHQEEQK